jgi:hypothetical protein
MRYLLLILGLLSLTACKHYFYFFNGPDRLELNQPAGIRVDSTFELYVRKVTRSGTTDKDLETTQALKASDAQPLIEIEYLLISDKEKKLIYLSTLADKTQKYYQTNYVGDGYINIYDFETLLFGVLKNRHTVEFISKDPLPRNRIVWNLSRNGPDIVIRDIQEFEKNEFQLYIPANQALKDPILFKRLSPFQFIYHKPWTPITENIIPLKDDLIHIDKEKNKYTAWFWLQRPLPNGYSKIKYLDRRIPFSPEPLIP